jgi:hypothetical protein
LSAILSNSFLAVVLLQLQRFLAQLNNALALCLALAFELAEADNMS